MTSLVSVGEYRTRTGDTSTPGERLKALLSDASSAILAEAHGQQIVQATSTDTIVFNYEGRFYLPQRPVTAVASVTVDGEVLDATAYRWTAGGNRRHAVIIRRVDGADASFTAAEATVTYTHGWATVPGQITMAIVAMVTRALSATGPGRDLTALTVGAVAEQYARPADGAAAMAADASTRTILDSLCGVDLMPFVPLGAS